jgi:hypothetical protein
MPLLGWLARGLLLKRLFGGRARRRSNRRAYLGGGPRQSVGYGRGRRGGVGLFGPVPYYSRRTRGGGRVSVGGCCLPIPLVLSASLAGTLRLLSSRR